MYRDKEGNPKYRICDTDIEFLKKARKHGIEKLTAVMDEVEDLPFVLGIEDGENELPEPLVIDFKRTLVLSDVHLGFHDRAR